MRGLLFCVGLLVYLCAVSAHGGQTRALIATGLGGTEQYQLEFQRHANRAASGLREVTDDVTLLIGETADRQALKTALDALSGRSQPDDTLVLLYIGHGSYDEEHFKFNIAGPDITAVELSDWLEAVPARHQLIVVTGSSSGAVQLVLEQEGRTVITGTRSGGQRNATVFGAYFTAALEEPAADVDKDQRITAAEAFRYAESGVSNHYTSDQEMSTENPLSKGPEPVMVLAHLNTLPTVDQTQSHLYAERESLELDIAGLRTLKATLSQEDYFAELQRLLLELALIEKQLEEQQLAGQETTESGPAEPEGNTGLETPGEAQSADAPR